MTQDRRRVAGSHALFPLQVLVDTNEIAHGRAWTFQGIEGGGRGRNLPLLVRTRPQNLLWGDYALEGFPDVVVERKTLPDLFRTLTEERDRFEEQIRSMSSYKQADVVVEGTWEQVFREPPTQARPRSVLATIHAFRVRFPVVHWHLVGVRTLAERFAFRLLERAFLETLPEREQKRLRYERVNPSWKEWDGAPCDAGPGPATLDGPGDTPQVRPESERGDEDFVAPG